MKRKNFTIHNILLGSLLAISCTVGNNAHAGILDFLKNNIDPYAYPVQFALGGAGIGYFACKTFDVLLQAKRAYGQRIHNTKKLAAMSNANPGVKTDIKILRSYGPDLQNCLKYKSILPCVTRETRAEQNRRHCLYKQLPLSLCGLAGSAALFVSGNFLSVSWNTGVVLGACGVAFSACTILDNYLKLQNLKNVIPSMPSADRHMKKFEYTHIRSTKLAKTPYATFLWDYNYHDPQKQQNAKEKVDKIKKKNNDHQRDTQSTLVWSCVLTGITTALFCHCLFEGVTARR